MHKLASQGASMDSRSKIRIEQFFGASGKPAGLIQRSIELKGFVPQLWPAFLSVRASKKECNIGVFLAL